MTSGSHWADAIFAASSGLEQYDEKETKMVSIIKEEKSMLKALARYNRY